MACYKLTLVLLLTCLASSISKELIKFTISSYLMPDKKLSMELDVVTPRTAGSYPPMLFVTGIEGLTPSVFQQKLIESVAEQGYIWMTVSKMQSPNPEKVSACLKLVIEWINGNLQAMLNSRVPGVLADIDDRMILVAHSAGSHVVSDYLNSTCGTVKLIILMSPVDGADPMGMKKDFIITPGKFLPFATPVMIIGTGLDPVPRKTEPACAPSKLSNTRFYNAMSGPKWFINATKYGHIDFYDDQYRMLSTMMCSTCTKNCDFQQYRTFIKEMILSFCDAILNKDSVALQYIEKNSFSINTIQHFDHMGYNPLQGGFCKRVNLNAEKKNLSQQ